MNDPVYVAIVIILMGAITIGLRATPFVAGHWLQRHAVVHKLGDALPLSIMVLLLVDTALGQAGQHAGWPWPEALAVAIVVLLQWRFRQTLASIVIGTAAYMLMRAFIG